MDNDKYNKLQMLDRINRVSPKESFLKALELEAVKAKKRSKVVNMNTVLGIAASLLLLVAINFKTILDTSISSNPEMVESTESGYTMIPTKTLYYE